MTLALAYWLILLLWTVFGALPAIRKGSSWTDAGASLMPWLAAVLIGWHVFGPPIHG